MSGPKNDDGNHQKRKASHIKNFTFTTERPEKKKKLAHISPDKVRSRDTAKDRYA
jgi:hypothetical protein